MILKELELPADKDQQVAITIREMSALVRLGFWDEEVRVLADRAVIGVFSTEDQIDAISNYVRQKMVFRFDPADTELIRVPGAMAHEILITGETWGDCDDYSILLASMLGSFGFVPGFVTMATDMHHPEFRHVFVVVALDTGLIYLDASVDRSYETGDLRAVNWWIKGDRPGRV